jgi:SAM-dependent methyltransferase
VTIQPGMVAGMRPDPTRHVPARTGETVCQRVAAAYDRVADRYDQAYADPGHRAEDAWLAGWLRPHLAANPDGLVLDLGCGTGWVLDQFPDLHPRRYLGVDISPRMLDHARTKHPRHAFEQADMGAMRTPQSAGSVVSVFGALNHHPYPQGVLLAAAAALQRGGRLALVVYGPRPQPLAIFNGDAPPPLRRFDPTALRWLVEGVGLAVLELRGFRRPAPRPPGWAPGWAHAGWLRAEQATLRPRQAVYLLLAAERRA